MASTAGLSAWTKYYEGKGNVTTVVKKDANTFTTSDKVGPKLMAGTPVVVLPLKNKKEYLSYVRGNASGEKANAHIPIMHGKIKLLCAMDNLAKPSDSTTIDLKLQTVNLIRGAPTGKFSFMGFYDVPCAVFSSAGELRTCVVKNLKSHTLLNTVPAFKKNLIEYFTKGDPTHITWLGAVGPGEKAQFAKYIGEVAIGLIILEGKAAVAMPGITLFPAGKKKFILPLDEAFPGADSLIRLDGGAFIPLSSKAGLGAAASFFSNLLGPILKNNGATHLGSGASVMKTIVQTAKNAGITEPAHLKTGSKKVVYEYGVREILKTNASTLPNSYLVYEEFKKFDKITDYSPEVREIYKKLKSVMTKMEDTTAIRNLDSSTTVFFSKLMAAALNANPASVKICKSVLSAKKFYQANLNVSELKQGNIRFSIIAADAGALTFIGTKSAYTNIDASQGSVNYYLK